jgi:hypothetical protein
MTLRSYSRCSALPLFGAEPDVWSSLDEPAQEQVLDCLALLLLRHLQQTACSLPQEQNLAKGDHP